MIGKRKGKKSMRFPKVRLRLTLKDNRFAIAALGLADIRDMAISIPRLRGLKADEDRQTNRQTRIVDSLANLLRQSSISDLLRRVALQVVVLPSNDLCGQNSRHYIPACLCI